MVSDQIKRDGLAALSFAAVELIEDHHDELVTTIPADPQAQRDRMRRLGHLGTALLALSKAALVLLDEPTCESEDTTIQRQ